MRYGLVGLVVSFVACSGHRTPEAPSSELQVVEEPMVFTSGSRTVHGTWTQPDVSWPVPAMLIIAGGGQTDRDWNSPLLQGDNGSGALLAHALAERGVASLRYDKYGLGGFDGELSWQDYTSEQQSGLSALAARQDVHSVWLAGHSEGGLHALMLANQTDVPIGGVILLATPGRTLQDVLVDQVERMAGPDVASSLDVALSQMQSSPETVHVSHPRVDAVLQSLQHPDTRPFISEMMTWEPTESVSRLDVPVLLVSGDKDLQISASQDTDALEAAGRGAANDVTRVDLPHSDHQFKLEYRRLEDLGERDTLAYNAANRTLDPALADAVAAWIYR